MEFGLIILSGCKVEAGLARGKLWFRGDMMMLGLW